MTNTIAAILTLIVTNTASIGTFTDKAGTSYDVQESKYGTNTVAIIEFEGQKREFILKSEPGPVIGEMKVPNWKFITNGTAQWYYIEPRTNTWTIPLPSPREFNTNELQKFRGTTISNISVLL